MPEFNDAQKFWDERFDTSDYIFGRTANVFLTQEAHRLAPGSTVLDVACGEGRNAVWLAEQGHAVHAFDVSPLALAKARLLSQDRGVSVRWSQADVRSWTWLPETYDAIVCIFIQFASPQERSRLFEGFRTALKPGGLVLMQGYTPKQLEYRTGGPGDVAHLYTPELLRDAFREFDLLRLDAHEAVLAEGTKHVGRSALIDLVARRKD
ncbi:MAG: class I SAM-dependent methyltransferase [Betaproteobacteria bacterium]|nr:class I SAM-dependent methyltransferase [Betaproteobacteria bacterium]